ncbi:hypothetical protein [Salinifilum ghardaiensis]
MGVRSALRRFAAGAPHVLVAETPGGAAARLAVEDFVRVRGWPVAASPADADVLVLAGPEHPELAGFVDRTWQQVPRPRVRVPVPAAADAGTALDNAGALLAEGGQVPQPVDLRPPEGAGGDHHGRGAGAERADGGSEHRHGHGSDHQGRDSDQRGHGGGHHHDHGSTADVPGGLAMAERGSDRDGLMLDQLHVPLGPVLPEWPAGLVVRMTVQGDVVQEAEVTAVSGRGPVEAFWNAPRRRAAAGHDVPAGEAARRCAAAHLDSLARLLAVVGWPDAVLEARRVRAGVLAGASTERVVPEVGRLARRLRRSRTLRWLTGEIGVLSRAAAERAGVTGPALRASRAAGDVRARWLTWLDELDGLVQQVDGTARMPEDVAPPRGEAGSAPLLAVLPDLLEGTEIAAARLIVASLDPDPAELAHASRGVPDG